MEYTAPQSLGSDTAFAASYRTLRGLANAYLRRSRPGVTLQATALVHEAYVKLAADARKYGDEAHFVRCAAMAMRQILVDHARARNSQKRGGGAIHLTLAGREFEQPGGMDVLLINDALERLGQWDPRQAQIVELRCFLGLSLTETALNLQLSEATVKREWAMARAWLEREIGPR